jgi:DNA processing protein
LKAHGDTREVLDIRSTLHALCPTTTWVVLIRLVGEKLEPQELKYWLALHSVEGIGAVTYQKLLDKFGSPKEVFTAKKEAITSIPRLSKDKADEILAVNEKMDNIDNLILRLDDLGVDILTIADQDYPALLRQVKNPPPIIYKYGQIQKQDERSIAIVGSRNANEKGLQIARGFGKRLAERGYTIVSGYAKGIDTESHLGALEGDGRTIMVLSTGMLHFKLRDAGFESFEFLKQNGAVISEMFPTESWTVGAAMARNRLVVGLSKAVLVVECGLESGTMNAAHVAQQMNRPLFVLQYQEVGEHVLGNEELLKSGAIAVRRFRDVKLIEKYIASS